MTAGPLPRGTHASLLRAALLDGDAARAAWKAWDSTVDFDRLDQPSYRLVPLLYRNLERLRVEDERMARLRGIYRRTWCENQILFRRVAGVVALLRDAGVETLVLKGAALASQAYRDAGARSMGDADVLVRRRDFAKALDVLRAVGWKAQRDREALWDASPDTFRDRYAGIGLRQAGDTLDVLDLHDRILKLYVHHPVPFSEERLWEDAEPFDMLGTRAWRLSPAHALLHVCFHGLQVQDVAPIRWIPDAHFLVVARGEDLDWEGLLRDARRHRVVAALKDGLSVIAARYGSPVPPPVLRALRRTPVPFVEKCERPLREGRRDAATDFAETTAVFLRRAGDGTRGARERTLDTLRTANRLLFRLPWKHGWSRLLRHGRTEPGTLSPSP